MDERAAQLDFIQTMPPTQILKKLACVACAIALPVSVTADELIRYTFEDLASPLTEAGPVSNTAPDQISDAATIVNAANMDVVTGNRVTFDGLRYDLGTSLNIITKSGHVNSGILLSQLNIRANTEYTAMAWMNVLDQSGDHMIFATNQAGRELHLGTRNAFYHSGHWGDDLQNNSTPQAMPNTEPGTWRHVTYQNRSDGTQLFYLNGVKMGEGAPQADGSKPDDSNLVIGDCRDARDYQGLLDEIKVFNNLLTEAEIRAAAVEGLTAVVEPAITSAVFTAVGEVEIQVTDFDDGMSTSTIDDSTVILLRDGVAVPATVTKNGGVTTITHTIDPADFVVWTQYQFTVEAETVELDDYQETVGVVSHAMPAEIRAGLDAPPNASVGWNVIEIATTDFPPPLTQISNGEQSYRDMLNVAQNGTITVQMDQPYINHSDPDNPGGQGDFCPDLPNIAEVPGVNDEHFVTHARTVITIGAGEEGDYTFRVVSDDGYGLRVQGATFTGTAGAAANTIDPNDPSTALHPLQTGNSNAYLHCNFPAPGDYPVDFVCNEIGGGAYQEISWAPGTFTNTNQSTAWQLVGDSSGFTGVSKWGDIPESVLPEIGSDGGWATRIFYGVGGQINGLGPAMNYLRGLDDGSSTFTNEFAGDLPYLNHEDKGTNTNSGRINPTDPIPGDPTPAGDTNDFVMLARAIIVAPADGEYSLQFRNDDGFLFRFLDPSVQFTSLSGAGTFHPTATNEVTFPANTGDTNTRATVFLTAGEYDAIFVWWERGGGAFFEISTLSGVHPSQDSAYAILTNVSSPTELFLGKTIGRRFEITEFVRDDTLEELRFTFNSVDGVDYAVDLSENLEEGFWFEGSDLSGEGESTTAAVGYDIIRLNLGLEPTDPIPDDIFGRIRDVNVQDDPNP